MMYRAMDLESDKHGMIDCQIAGNVVMYIGMGRRQKWLTYQMHSVEGADRSAKTFFQGEAAFR